MGKKSAFTALLDLHTSTGAPCQLDYGPLKNGPENWDGKVFTVKKEGIYAITVSYVRDSQVPTTGGLPGTKDDTNLQVLLNRSLVGYAWAGETSASRQCATSTFLLPMSEDDELSTQDWAAKPGEIRRFRHCVLTVFRIAKS